MAQRRGTKKWRSALIYYKEMDLFKGMCACVVVTISPLKVLVMFVYNPSKFTKYVCLLLEYTRDWSFMETQEYASGVSKGFSEFPNLWDVSVLPIPCCKCS